MFTPTHLNFFVLIPKYFILSNVVSNVKINGSYLWMFSNVPYDNNLPEYVVT
jgi:hypothetical protein